MTPEPDAICESGGAQGLPGGWLIPDWPAPANVRALCTTRVGGVSQGLWASLNLASHVGDDPLAVAANRGLLQRHLPAAPVWLAQVHGTGVIDPATHVHSAEPPEADAARTCALRTPCAVLTADCLPVLFCDEAGSVVAAAHAGWRGLAAGVLEATVRCDGAAGATAVAAALARASAALPDLTARADDDRVRVRATLDPAALGRMFGPS